MLHHSVTGGGGCTIHVAETGNPTGPPILFVHGFSQNLMCWSKQLHDPALLAEFRLVAMDLRGHGHSDKPLDAYGDGALWADDVRAVIDELGLHRPTVHGWSYGGSVIADHLAAHGTGRIAGVELVGAVSDLNQAAMVHVGSGFSALAPAFFSNDAVESVAGLTEFLHLSTHHPVSDGDFYFFLGFNAAVPPHVRHGLLSRQFHHDDVIRGLDVPLQLTHGEMDRIVLPSMAQHHAGLQPAAMVSWYPDVGHAPFWEAPERYNAEVAAFRRHCR
jgi:pimeloyl-ACP methyl ester carboxylesterase